jgi:GT2 family glycosyltransferase
MKLAQPRVTIAILTYDGRELLDVVVPSVLALRTADAARVLVLDNGSRDGSPDYVRARWPTVEILEIPCNIGVAAALNRAVLAAAESELVALLNNDVELDPDWLLELSRALEDHPEAASASGKLLYFHDRSTIDAAGSLVLWSGAVIGRGHGMRDGGQFDTATPLFGANGAAALYRRSAFDLVGLFDGSFGGYFEDVDWYMRAQLAGFTSRYVPSAVAYHIGSATTRRFGGLPGRQQRRTTPLLIVKDFPADALLRHGWKVVVNQLLSLAASVRDGKLREQLHAWVELLPMLPRALRARRVIHGSRVASTRELDAAIEASLPWHGSRAERLLFELAPRAAGRLRQRSHPPRTPRAMDAGDRVRP